MSLRRVIASFRAAARRHARPAGILAALCLSGCLAGGGTGTDTENGIAARVTDSLGAPLAGVLLRLYYPDYRPDSGQVAADPVADEYRRMETDERGYAYFNLKAAGKFVVEGISPAQGNTMFFDTLAVSDLRQKAGFTFRVRSAKAFQGKVRLASGMRIDSGRVFIRGTGVVCRVDSAGGYDLGLLPVDIERMAIGARLTSSPVAVLKAMPIKNSQGTDTLTKSGYACTALSADSAGKVVQPARSGTQPDAVSRLDTAHVDSALKSCGPLQPGSVINYTGASAPVVSMDGAPSVNLLVIKAADTTNYTSPKTLEPVVVPLSQCVAAPGKETTVFDVDVVGNDLAVGDVAQSCLTQ